MEQAGARIHLPLWRDHLLPLTKPDAGAIARLHSDPRWLEFVKFIESEVSEKLNLLGTRKLVTEDDVAKANVMIGEIKALREIVETPAKLADREIKGLLLDSMLTQEIEGIMAEQEQQEFSASWEETPEYGDNEAPVPAEETPQIEAEAEPAQEVEEEAEENPKLIGKTGIKILNNHIQDSGNELHALKQEQDALRLEKLEMQQRMLELEQKVKDVDSLREQVDSKPDPLDESIFTQMKRNRFLKITQSYSGWLRKWLKRISNVIT